MIYSQIYKIISNIRSLEGEKKMVIKKQYEEYCQSEKKILQKIQKFSVLISLFFLVLCMLLR